MDLIAFKWQRTTATTTGWKILRSSLHPNIIYIPVVVFYWNNRWIKKNIMCNKCKLLVENAHTMFLTLLKNCIFLTKNNPCCTIINRLLHKTFYQPFFKFIKTIFKWRIQKYRHNIPYKVFSLRSRNLSRKNKRNMISLKSPMSVRKKIIANDSFIFFNKIIHFLLEKLIRLWKKPY